jgi:hypothetical protein
MRISFENSPQPSIAINSLFDLLNKVNLRKIDSDAAIKELTQIEQRIPAESRQETLSKILSSAFPFREGVKTVERTAMGLVSRDSSNIELREKLMQMGAKTSSIKNLFSDLCKDDVAKSQSEEARARCYLVVLFHLANGLSVYDAISTKNKEGVLLSSDEALGYIIQSKNYSDAEHFIGTQKLNQILFGIIQGETIDNSPHPNFINSIIDAEAFIKVPGMHNLLIIVTLHPNLDNEQKKQYIQQLIQAGADVNLLSLPSSLSESALSPIAYAAKGKNWELVRFFAELPSFNPAAEIYVCSGGALQKQTIGSFLEKEIAAEIRLEETASQKLRSSAQDLQLKLQRKQKIKILNALIEKIKTPAMAVASSASAVEPAVAQGEDSKQKGKGKKNRGKKKKKTAAVPSDSEEAEAVAEDEEKEPQKTVEPASAASEKPLDMNPKALGDEVLNMEEVIAITQAIDASLKPDEVPEAAAAASSPQISAGKFSEEETALAIKISLEDSAPQSGPLLQTNSAAAASTASSSLNPSSNKPTIKTLPQRGRTIVVSSQPSLLPLSSSDISTPKPVQTLPQQSRQIILKGFPDVRDVKTQSKPTAPIVPVIHAKQNVTFKTPPAPVTPQPAQQHRQQQPKSPPSQPVIIARAQQPIVVTNPKPQTPAESFRRQPIQIQASAARIPTPQPIAPVISIVNRKPAPQAFVVQQHSVRTAVSVPQQTPVISANQLPAQPATYHYQSQQAPAQQLPSASPTPFEYAQLQQKLLEVQQQQLRQQEQQFLALQQERTQQTQEQQKLRDELRLQEQARQKLEAELLQQKQRELEEREARVKKDQERLEAQQRELENQQRELERRRQEAEQQQQYYPQNPQQQMSNIYQPQFQQDQQWQPAPQPLYQDNITYQPHLQAPYTAYPPQQQFPQQQAPVASYYAPPAPELVIPNQYHAQFAQLPQPPAAPYYHPGFMTAAQFAQQSPPPTSTTSTDNLQFISLVRGGGKGRGNGE